MPFNVYVLRSLKNGKRYIGYTSKTAEARLHDHLTGSNPWTRANNPFILIHEESCESKTDAIKREHFLKSGRGREWLDKNIPR